MRSRRPLRLALPVVLAVALAACGTSAASPSSATTSGPGATTAAPAARGADPVASGAASPDLPAPVALDPATATPLPWRVGRTLEIGGSGSALLADGQVFVVDEMGREFTGGVPNGHITRVDPDTMKVTGTAKHAIGGFPITADGAVWLINAEFGQTVTRVDLDTLEVRRFRTSPLPDPTPEAIAYAGGYIWVGNNHEGTIAKVDPATLQVLDRLSVVEPGEWGVRGRAASDGTSAWFGISRDGTIVRIDAAAGREVSRFTLPTIHHDVIPDGLTAAQSSPPETMLSIGDELWVQTLDRLYVIDVATPGQERIVAALGTEAQWDTQPVSDGKGSVWTLLYGPTTTIVQIDVATRSVVGTFSDAALGTSFGRLVPADGKLFFRTEGRLIELLEGPAR